MYVSFYNLGKEDGITFPVERVTICGSTLRLQIDGEWHFVAVYDDFDIYINDKKYIDFAVEPTPCSTYELIHDGSTLEGITPQ
jgi:hypothetical protein